MLLTRSILTEKSNNLSLKADVGDTVFFVDITEDFGGVSNHDLKHGAELTIKTIRRAKFYIDYERREEYIYSGQIKEDEDGFYVLVNYYEFEENPEFYYHEFQFETTKQ
jgi:hypothetical protein